VLWSAISEIVGASFTGVIVIVKVCAADVSLPPPTMPAVLPLTAATGGVALVVRNFTRCCHRDRPDGPDGPTQPSDSLSESDSGAPRASAPDQVRKHGSGGHEVDVAGEEGQPEDQILCPAPTCWLSLDPRSVGAAGNRPLGHLSGGDPSPTATATS